MPDVALNFNLPTEEDLLETLAVTGRAFSGVFSAWQTPPRNEEADRAQASLSMLNLILAAFKIFVTYSTPFVSKAHKYVNMLFYPNETDDAIRSEMVPFKVMAQGVYDPAKRKREKKERDAKFKREEIKAKATADGSKDYMASIKAHKPSAERLAKLQATVVKTYAAHPMTTEAFTPVMADNSEDQRLSNEEAVLAKASGLRNSQREARAEVRDDLRAEAQVNAQKRATDAFKARIYDKSGQKVATEQAKVAYLESVAGDVSLIAIREDDNVVDGKKATDEAYQKWVGDLSNKVDAEVVGWAQTDVINGLRVAKMGNAWTYYQQHMKDGKTPTDGKALQQAAGMKSAGAVTANWEKYKSAVEGMSGDTLTLDPAVRDNGIISTLDQLLDDFALDAVMLLSKTKKTLKNQFLQEMKQPARTAAARFECKESTEVCRRHLRISPLLATPLLSYGPAPLTAHIFLAAPCDVLRCSLPLRTLRSRWSA